MYCRRFWVATQLWPGNPESVAALSDLLSQVGRVEEARHLREQFSRDYPDQQDALERMAA